MPICDAGKPELASELALHFDTGGLHEPRALSDAAAENSTAIFPATHSNLRHALELVSAPAPGSNPELEIEILQRIGDTQYILGEMSDSAVSYEAAVDLAERAGLRAAHARALVQLGFPAWYLDAARGSKVCRQAIEVSESLDDPLLVAQTRLAVAGFRFVYDARKKTQRPCPPPSRSAVSAVRAPFTMAISTWGARRPIRKPRDRQMP